MPEAHRRPRRRVRAVQPVAPLAETRADVHGRQVRSDENIARQTAYMVNEMKRVLGVSALCFGMLALLVVIDRLQ